MMICELAVILTRYALAFAVGAMALRFSTGDGSRADMLTMGLGAIFVVLAAASSWMVLSKRGGHEPAS